MQSVSGEFSHSESLLTLLQGEYLLVSLEPRLGRVALVPVQPDSVFILVHDPVETTLIILASDWQRLAADFPRCKVQTGYRAIRLSQNFPLETVGVLKKLTTALSNAGVSIMAYSTYRSDVLLVREHELAQALGALWNLRFDDAATDLTADMAADDGAASITASRHDLADAVSDIADTITDVK
jgi:hypothetical protein